MTNPARREIIEQLRARILGPLPPRPAGRPCPGLVLPSGWDAVDGALPNGGLGPGETAVLEGPPGSGRLALAGSWARSAAERGEAALVVDAGSVTLPHVWTEPPGAPAPIWVVRPRRPAEAWPALDIALRSGAFGLLVLLEPDPPRPGVAARLLRLCREHGCRVILTGPAPFRPTAHLTLRAVEVRWRSAPVGDAPELRSLRVSLDSPGTVACERTEVQRDDSATDRLRARPRAPDRRPPQASGGPGRSGRTRR